jgi:hypothetical protein
MIALRAAVFIFLQIIRMDHLIAVGAFNPAAIAVFLGTLDLDLRLIS